MNEGEKYQSRRIAGFLGTKNHEQELRTQPDEWHGTSSKEIEKASTEDTAWEIYNRKAALYDRELVKDWNDSLNTLLIFVSSFPVNESTDSTFYLILTKFFYLKIDYRRHSIRLF